MAVGAMCLHGERVLAIHSCAEHALVAGFQKEAPLRSIGGCVQRGCNSPIAAKHSDARLRGALQRIPLSTITVVWEPHKITPYSRRNSRAVQLSTLHKPARMQTIAP